MVRNFDLVAWGIANGKSRGKGYSIDSYALKNFLLERKWTSIGLLKQAYTTNEANFFKELGIDEPTLLMGFKEQIPNLKGIGVNKST